MTASKYLIGIATLVLSAHGAGLAHAADIYLPPDALATEVSYGEEASEFVLRGSIGVATIEAREKVFALPESDDLLSLLVWQSTAPIASIDAKTRFGGLWTLRGRVDVALAGSSHMTDTDWGGPDFVSYAPEDWTDRSLHPNTNLDWYFNGEIALGRDLPVNEQFSVNANVGLKYTDVKWTATGGSGIYSGDDVTGPGHFRDYSLIFPDTPGIDYRMRLPTAFAGVDGYFNDGPWTFAAGAKLGTTFMAGDTDNHILRDLRFEDSLNWALVYSADARATYALGDHVGVFLEGDYGRTVSGHGTESVYDRTTGELLASFPGAVAGELQVASLKAGIRGTF
jgi:outer membrane protease